MEAICGESRWVDLSVLAGQTRERGLQAERGREKEGEREGKREKKRGRKSGERYERMLTGEERVSQRVREANILCLPHWSPLTSHLVPGMGQRRSIAHCDEEEKTREREGKGREGKGREGKGREDKRKGRVYK